MSIDPETAASICWECVKKGGTIFICGNGGSAAMASHFAAELVVRYERNRRAIPCLCLSADPCVLTAIANDFGYEEVFARQLQAFARPGDVLIPLTTSGRSKNVLRAMISAEARGMEVIQPDTRLSDESTGQCQERHLSWLHALAGTLERLVQTYQPELAL